MSLDAIGNDLFWYLLRFLDYRSLLILRTTCKTFFEFITDWIEIRRRRYPVVELSLVPRSAKWNPKTLTPTEDLHLYALFSDNSTIVAQPLAWMHFVANTDWDGNYPGYDDAQKLREFIPVDYDREPSVDVEPWRWTTLSFGKGDAGERTTIGYTGTEEVVRTILITGTGTGLPAGEYSLHYEFCGQEIICMLEANIGLRMAVATKKQLLAVVRTMIVKYLVSRPGVFPAVMVPWARFCGFPSE